MIKPSALTHICANYTYNHVFYDVCAQTDCMNVQTFAQKIEPFWNIFLFTIEIPLIFAAEKRYQLQTKAKFNINGTNI